MTGAPPLTGVAAAARCLALDQHAVTVVTALEQAGVTALILKGPGLARRLYAADPGRRRYSDVDVLVAPADFDRAQQVLARSGHRDVAAEFPEDEWLWHERPWVRDGPVPLTVDLHRGFAGVGDPQALWELLRPDAEELPLSGGTVRVPDVVGTALLVALHAAAPGKGRKPMADLVVALEQLPEPVWREAAAWAVTTRAQSAFVSGLGRVAEGRSLLVELRIAPRRPLASLLNRLDLVLLRRSIDWVLEMPGVRSKVRHVARRLVPTPAFMRQAAPLAQRGTVGLGVAYVVRPLRLLLPARLDERTAEASVRRRVRRGATSLVGRVGQWRPGKLRAGVWALSALEQVRRDLARGPLDQVRPAAAPRGGAGAGSTVRRMLRRRGASCLERSLVLQRWEAGQGRAVELVVGVTSPQAGFRAHAWLATDAEAAHHHASMTEMLRRPTPPAWLRSR